MDFLKGMWYVWKVKSYEKLIRNITSARAKLKSKQELFTTKYKEYKDKLDGHTKI